MLFTQSSEILYPRPSLCHGDGPSFPIYAFSLAVDTSGGGKCLVIDATRIETGKAILNPQ